jgi:hypothetical protein
MKNLMTSGFCSVALLISVFTTPIASADEPSSYSSPWTEAQLVECRIWAANFWAWYETGEVPQGANEFQFSFPAGKDFNPLYPTEYIFSKLYASELSLNYSIYDLINDDADVYLAFRHHSLTGVIITSFDSPAAGPHMNLITLALNPEQDADCEVTTSEFPNDGIIFDFTSDSVISNLIFKKNISYCPFPEGLPPDRDDFALLVLSPLLTNSGLSNLDGGCAPAPSLNPWGEPGFACDGFAEALRHFLDHNLRSSHPNMHQTYLLLRWPGNGHAMNVIESGGKHYLIDVQTNTVQGPFESMNTLIASAWDIIKQSYNNGSRPWFTITSERDSPRGIMNTDAWYHSHTVRQKIKDCLGITDDSQYLPDDFGG